MSTMTLYIIPHDPLYVPSNHAIEEVIKVLQTSFPEYDEITTATEQVPLFLHPVEMYEGTFCPICLQEVSDWLEELWRLDSKEQWNPLAKGVRLPCCGATIPINALDYRSDAGFARFRIAVQEPALSWRDVSPLPFGIAVFGGEPDPQHIKPNWWFTAWLSDERLFRVGEILGCTVKQFFQRI